MKKETSPQNQSIPPIYVVSGSSRGVGEQLVSTILAQFEAVTVPVVIHSDIRNLEQIKTIVAEATANQGTIIHTLVDPKMRHALLTAADSNQVVTIDLAGPLIRRLTNLLGQEPIGQPGLYRQLHEAQFKRIEAMEYTLAHDDGKNFMGWAEADIVVLGVSRVYKTPLSLYLATMGWKVANIPIINDIWPRTELFELDRRRVVGLLIDADQLLHHRQHRQRHLGVRGRSTYVDPTKLYEELEFARSVYRRGQFATVDVTDKPIETSAEEVIATITRRLGMG